MIVDSGGGGRLTPKSLWRGVLIGVLGLALATPSRAESVQTAGKQVVAGIVVVSVGIGVLVTVLIVRHNSKQNKITGCISSGTKGLSVTDEKDQRAYALSGDVNGVKPGERMALVGKRDRTTLILSGPTSIQGFRCLPPIVSGSLRPSTAK